MLSELSWGDYIMSAVILLAVYYTAIALIYYPGEIRGLIRSPKRTMASAGLPTNAEGPADNLPSEDSQNLVNEINSILQHAGKQAGKPVLLPQLKQALASYPGLRVPAYRNAVLNHIVQQAEALCGLRISVQELVEGD